MCQVVFVVNKVDLLRSAAEVDEVQRYGEWRVTGYREAGKHGRWKGKGTGAGGGAEGQGLLRKWM